MKILIPLLFVIASFIVWKSWYLIDPYYRMAVYQLTPTNSIELENADLLDRNFESVSFSSVIKPQDTVYFWASWCKPCLVTLTDIASKQNDPFYRSVVLVSLEDDIESTLNSISDLQLSNPMFFGSDEMFYSGYFGNSAQGIPYSITVNDEGAVDSRALGRDEIEKMWSTTITNRL